MCGYVHTNTNTYKYKSALFWTYVVAYSLSDLPVHEKMDFSRQKLCLFGILQYFPENLTDFYILFFISYRYIFGRKKEIKLTVIGTFKGQSNEIFDLLFFFFLISTSLGHLPMG